MRNIGRHKDGRKIWESKPVLFLLGCAVLLFVWSVLGFYSKMAETRRKRLLQEEKAETFQSQKETLLRDIASLKTERGKEEFFRENFGLAKAGEELTIVMEDQAGSAPQPKSSLSGFFAFFKNLFR